MPAPTVRLEARISPDLRSLLERAAELQGRTMTDFVVAAVHDAAQRTIEQAEVVRLSLAAQRCFAEALLAPPKPSAALKRAMARHKALFEPSASAKGARRLVARKGTRVKPSKSAAAPKQPAGRSRKLVRSA